LTGWYIIFNSFDRQGFVVRILALLSVLTKKMSKSLFLLRHGHALEKTADQKDTDRELSPIGLQNASRMGMKLLDDEQKFDLILSSTAVRALTTASLVAEQVGYDPSRIHQNKEIYDASVRTLLQVVNRLKEEWNSVLIVGHNPSMSYLAEYMSDAEVGNLATCGLAHFSFTMSWE
jgi:phosphohistidine phosphatase